jgi:Zn-dependent alcohol dehydrogenase
VGADGLGFAVAILIVLAGRNAMRITAAVTETRDAPFQLTELSLDDPRPDEMVVRIAAAGMCHTDLSVRQGSTPFPLPAVLGHEGAGVVDNVGSQVAGFVVFGAGGVGLAAVMAAKLTPAARIVAVDVIPVRLKLARDLGATHTVNGGDTDATEALAELTRGAGANYAIETSGRPAVLQAAIASLASAGTCVVIGAPPLGTTIPVDVPDLLGRGLRLLGTNQGDSNPQLFLPRLIDLFRQGRLPFDRLIRRFPFKEINQAAAETLDGTVLKPVLVMPPPT